MGEAKRRRREWWPLFPDGYGFPDGMEVVVEQAADASGRGAPTAIQRAGCASGNSNSRPTERDIPRPRPGIFIVAA